MQKIKPTFKQDVSETLLIPLCVRAKETRHKRPIISDKVSAQLLRKVDYDFSKFSGDRQCQLSISLRTKYLDNALRKFVETYDDAVVVLLACGLDPRIERIGLDKDFQAYEVDFPDVIHFRNQLLPETEKNRYISTDITSTEWVKRIRAAHPTGHFLFIMEGVAMYLTEEQVKRIFGLIDENFDHAEIYIERINRYMSSRTQSQKSVSNTNALFSWGCNDPHEIERWGNRFRFQQDYYYYQDDFVKALGRIGAKALLYRCMPIYRRLIGIWSYKNY